jgi:hypothetical protein
MKLAAWIKRKLHKHDFLIIYGTLEPCGVTLGWDCRPTTEYQHLERCSCGEERTTRGWVLPRRLEELRSNQIGNPQVALYTPKQIT